MSCLDLQTRMSFGRLISSGREYAIRIDGVLNRTNQSGIAVRAAHFRHGLNAEPIRIIASIGQLLPQVAIAGHGLIVLTGFAAVVANGDYAGYCPLSNQRHRDAGFETILK